jgi:hypothetical protein
VIDREPGETYTGLFEPTPRNGPAAGLFESTGFQPGESSNWVLQDRAAVPAVPAWFSEDA